MDSRRYVQAFADRGLFVVIAVDSAVPVLQKHEVATDALQRNSAQVHSTVTTELDLAQIVSTNCEGADVLQLLT